MSGTLPSVRDFNSSAGDLNNTIITISSESDSVCYTGMGFADDFTILSSTSDSVFEDSALTASEADPNESVTKSITDASSNGILGSSPDTPLTVAYNLAGRRFERGTGLANIRNDLLHLKPVILMITNGLPAVQEFIKYLRFRIKNCSNASQKSSIFSLGENVKTSPVTESKSMLMNWSPLKMLRPTTPTWLYKCSSVKRCSGIHLSSIMKRWKSLH